VGICGKCREQSRLAWAKTRDPTSKITRANRTKGMAQVVECLPGKHKTPSSNHSTTKKKKKKKREKETKHRKSNS
jgi:hypothetical protein